MYIHVCSLHMCIPLYSLECIAWLPFPPTTFPNVAFIMTSHKIKVTMHRYSSLCGVQHRKYPITPSKPLRLQCNSMATEAFTYCQSYFDYRTRNVIKYTDIISYITVIIQRQLGNRVACGLLVVHTCGFIL